MSIVYCICLNYLLDLFDLFKLFNLFNVYLAYFCSNKLRISLSPASEIPKTATL